MPITESTMTHEEMQSAVNQGYLCGKCQGRLTVAWGGAFGINGYILRCGKDIAHEGITRHDKTYEQKLKEGFSMDSNALMTMGEAKMLQRVEMARFPQDLTVAEKKLLAQVALTYGFDPLMGEVTIYQGRPYVSIDGRYRKAQETGQLDGVETRPATTKEKDAWQIPDGDYFYRSEVFVKGASHPFVAWGRVYQAETKITKPGDAYKPVVKGPQRMAEKRGEAQALRKAFHIPLPSIEDIGSPDIDFSTGEINDAAPVPLVNQVPMAKVIDVAPIPKAQIIPESPPVPIEATLQTVIDEMRIGKEKEPSRRDKIFAKIKENKPALRTNANVRAWLVGVNKIPVEQVDDLEDLSWWETVKALQGWTD